MFSPGHSHDDRDHSHDDSDRLMKDFFSFFILILMKEMDIIIMIDRREDVKKVFL